MRSGSRASQVLLLRHGPTGVDIDLSIAWLLFELEAISAAETTRVRGVRVRLARAEDLVVYKAIAWRPQDQTDAERLVARHCKRMDLARVRREVAALVAALDDPDRLRAFDRVIARARAEARRRRRR